MKPTLPRERAGNELSPVIPNPLGVPNLVSILVSVVDALTPKPLLHAQLGMEPMAGIEPATDGLRNRCSTAELHWHPKRGPDREAVSMSPTNREYGILAQGEKQVPLPAQQVEKEKASPGGLA